MVKFGLIGMGGIGGVHLSALEETPGARVTALCDKAPERAPGQAAGISAGRRDTTQTPSRFYTDFRALLRDPEVDAVDICLPTDLHAEVAIAALEAGKHVLCEKPMALTVAECDRMIAAAHAANRVLMIAHCIRFWPEYAVLKAMVDSGDYGEVTYAGFTRLSPLPDWSAGNWMLDPARSGGGLFDLHIHDADFVTYLLGMPHTVFATGVKGGPVIEQVIAEYTYGGNELILAEGGRSFPKTFPFRMTFLVHLEGATIEFDAARSPLTVYPEDGDPFTPELPAGTGYTREIAYFVDCVERGIQPTLTSAFAARETIRLLRAEVESIRTGKPVEMAGFTG